MLERMGLLGIGRKVAFLSIHGLLLNPFSVLAAEWSISPSVSVREEFNDNVRFIALPHSNVWMTRVSPRVEASGKTEVSEVTVAAQVNLNSFAGDSSLNRNDQFYSFLGSTRSELNTWAVNASYNSDSVAETERITTGVVVQDRPQRDVFTFKPSWTRTLSERSQIRLGYSYQDVSYSRHISLTDYINHQVDGSLMYQLTDQDQVSISLNYNVANYAGSTYRFPNQIPVAYPPFIFLFPGGGIYSRENSVTGNGIQAGATHVFSERLKGTLSLGLRDSSTKASYTCNGELGTIFPTTNIVSCSGYRGDPLISFDNTVKNSGSSFALSVEQDFVSGSFKGMLSRETNPSGVGLVETDRYGISVSHDFNEKLSGNLDATAYTTRYLGIVYPDSNYSIIEPRLRWRFSEWTTLDAGYRYARYELDNSTPIRTANSIYLNLTYNWQKLSISR